MRYINLHLTLTLTLFSSYERRHNTTEGPKVASQVPLPITVNYLGFVCQQSTGLSADLWKAVQQHSSPSCTACLRKSSVHLLHLHLLNACLATLVSSWDHTGLEWGTRCCQACCSWNVTSMSESTLNFCSLLLFSHSASESFNHIWCYINKLKDVNN